MGAPRQLSPVPWKRAPLPAQVSIAEFPPHELAEFIDSIELPNAPAAGLDTADCEAGQGPNADPREKSLN
jgi:hypothetical protein